MNKKETGEFIFRFYRKRTASFLANLYKASITGDCEDIHKARVDVKKIIALFRLYEMILPGMFQKEDHYVIFKRLFDIAGKIREIQVNGILLNKFSKDNPESLQFKSFLKSEETRLTKQFLLTVQRFEDRNLKKTEAEIKRIGKKISQKKFIDIAFDFIIKKIQKTRKILLEKKSPEYLHKVRQNLKVILAIATLSNTIKKVDKLNEILIELSKAEIHIGEWHDKQVFIGSIEVFLKKKTSTIKRGFPFLRKLKKQLIEESLVIQGTIVPELEMILRIILDSPSESNS
jgi:CHAD domain-containing protein